jgi:cyclopropane fatty-acyl-phospholipid synthase-like methyltransferase
LRHSDWDIPYQAKDYLFGERPNRHLVAERKLFQPNMKALAIGDGEGRNGVWLACQGLDVLSIDLSEVGLSKARQLAALKNVCIRTLQLDIRDYKWPAEAFDLIVSVFVHFDPLDRPYLHERMQYCLKTGGILVLISFGPRQSHYSSGGPQRQELYYTTEEIRRDFCDMNLLRLDEYDEDLCEGRAHTGKSHVISFVARKCAVPHLRLYMR